SSNQIVHEEPPFLVDDKNGIWYYYTPTATYAQQVRRILAGLADKRPGLSAPGPQTCLSPCAANAVDLVLHVGVEARHMPAVGGGVVDLDGQRQIPSARPLGVLARCHDRREIAPRVLH